MIDALCSIPFARLRQQNKPVNFAAARIANILVNIVINVFFLWYCPNHVDAQWIKNIYQPENKVLYVFVANVAGSLTSLLLVSKQFRSLIKGFDRQLWKEMMRYGLPMLLIGLAGMVNETLDRVMLNYLLPKDVAMFQTGIYGTCYKLSIFMTIFVQAFRFAAEPFFFSRSEEKDAKQTYALVMDWFVIACAIIFLGMTLGIDIAKHFIDQKFWSGLHIVPVLLLANWFLGIYINISIWYKVTDNTKIGSYISIGGAVLTLVGLYIFVPIFGYTAAAWTTLVCYASMMVSGYILGRKYYPVPYRLTRNMGIIAVTLGIYFINIWIKQ
ncbi:MAG: oligosaccharide flippase family protein [Bacteroidetes bacterium]|nr:oligosaccharide flippase family protein [Bacteroidota bacterium]